MTDMSTAKTILEQLGGSRFVVMTGSKNFVGSENALRFKVGSNAKKVTHVTITLTAADLYDVEFLNVRGMNVKPLSSESGLYADMLEATFTEHTGLYTRF